MRFYGCITGVIFLFALGIVMMIKANIGVPPWDMLHIALSEITGLTILVSLVCLLAGYVSSVKPGVITLFDAILKGLFIDLIMFSGFIPEQTTMMEGVFQFVVGLAIVSFAIAIVFQINLSFGVRDSITIAVANKFAIDRGIAKFIVEFAVFVLAFMLGGPLGIGTVIVVVLVGVFINLWLKLLANSNLREIVVGNNTSHG